MKASITVASKKRGRPPSGGRDPGVHIRLPEEMLVTIDARSVAEGVSRSEAIRRLLELGLSVEPPWGQRLLLTAKESAARAVELAGTAIDKHSDKNASDDERSTRKRKLIQGPSVFRDARKDRPGKGAK